ncbi:MAG: glycosyltransferase [Planctomycetaceae bacterium]|nr:MAG: glycosyltransferase [Planctomycetaceae bacterium]
MKIWMPYLAAGTGADVSTQYLARGLEERGHTVVLQPFSRWFEPVPWLLRAVKPPEGTEASITNTWNGFAFARPGIPMITVDRLFVLDPALTPYKSPLQGIYHNTFVRRFVTASARRAEVVVAVSEYTADMIARTIGVCRPKVILNAVDTEFFTPAGRTGAPNGTRPICLLHVGKPSRRKGADLLPPIMKSLGAGYQLYYTGSESAFSEYGKPAPNMTSLGRLSQEEIRDQYRRADVLLFPSRGEGLARAIMEALACGTPVVAANISSMPEAVDDHVGRLCPPDDIPSFVAAIKTLTSDDKIWQQHSNAARQRAEQRFCLNRLLDEFEALLAGVVAR